MNDLHVGWTRSVWTGGFYILDIFKHFKTRNDQSATETAEEILDYNDFNTEDMSHNNLLREEVAYE